LCRGAVPQDFDAIDGGYRNRVQVDSCGTAPDAAVQVNQRALVAAFAVDQHEDLIRTEAAQRRRPHRVGAVGDRWPRKVQRRRQRLDDLCGFDVAARGDLLLREDVDRNCLLVFRARRTRSDGHLFAEVEHQRDVHGDRWRIDNDLNQCRSQAERVHSQLQLLVSHERRRH
jgi:hypothetical protein